MVTHGYKSDARLLCLGPSLPLFLSFLLYLDLSAVSLDLHDHFVVRGVLKLRRFSESLSCVNFVLDFYGRLQQQWSVLLSSAPAFLHQFAFILDCIALTCVPQPLVNLSSPISRPFLFAPPIPAGFSRHSPELFHLSAGESHLVYFIYSRAFKPFSCVPLSS
jgi:hypothetical protein